MKKILVLLMCGVVMTGCSNTEKEDEITAEEGQKLINEAEEILEEAESIDGFEKAEYDRFNSYASENGLGDTPIYIEGKVLNQTKLENNNSEIPELALIIEENDGDRWCASVASESKIDEITDKNVRIFGTYLGYSDVFNLPGLAVVYTDGDVPDMKLARIEINQNGKYEEVWNFYDDYAKDEIADIVNEENGNNAENETKQSTNETPDITIGQSNALESALLYLETMPFSYTGLIEQLEYEGYSTEDATYAADNCGADWNEQAVKSAKSYLDLMPFSKEELISQLEYEGFTHEQAVYGVEQNGY